MQRTRMIVGVAGALALLGAALFAGKGRDGDATTPIPAASERSGADEGPARPAPVEIALAPSPAHRVADAPSAGAPATPATTPLGEGRRVTITEHVLSSDGKPLAGATVEVRVADEIVGRTTSDPSGAVSIDVVTPERPDATATVVTRAAGGLVAIRPASWWLGTPGSRMTRVAKIELGDVTLALGVSVVFLVTDASGAGAVADLVVTQQWWPTQPIATARSAASGLATIEALAPGAYYAYARGTAGRSSAWFALPRKDTGSIELRLAGLHDVDVTVVSRETGIPVADARVELYELTMTPQGAHTRFAYLPRVEVPPTDARGRTKLVGLSKGASIGVSVTAAGFLAPNPGVFGRRADPMVPPDGSSLEIALEKGRTVSWEVTSGEVPPPPEGTILTLEQQSGSGTAPPSGTGRMSGGKIVIDGVPPEPTHWLAVAPDGSQAPLFSLPEESEGHATSFATTRKVDVTLRWSSGAPATGLYVSLRNQGNNPMGSVVVTDEKGAATLDHLESRMVDVYVGMTNIPYGGRRIATADLTKASATVVAVLPTRRVGTITVFLDGVAGLPPEFQTFGSSFGATVEVRITARDAKSGTVQLEIWPIAIDGKAEFGFETPGWLANTTVPVPSGSGPFQGRLDLRRAGGVDVDVVKAKGSRVSLRLDRVDERGAASDAPTRIFNSDSYGPAQAQIDAEGHWRLPTVAPGRYRVRDTVSSSTSVDFDVVAGATASVRFDCSNVGTVEGTVVVPEGESAEGLLVHLFPAPPSEPFGRTQGARTGPDGHFKITVPGDRELVLTADDTVLMPAPEGGNARTRAGATDATIRLVRGPVCHIQFDRAPVVRTPFDRTNSTKVYLWKGAMTGTPIAELLAVIDGTDAKFGHYEPGTYTLFIQLLIDAPVVLPGVRLGDGETRIGPVPVSAGSSLVFEISALSGQSVPRLYASAVRIDGKPVYQRSGDAVDRGRVTGLGKGRFRVSVRPQMGGASVLDQEVDADGTSDIPLRLEFK